MSTLTRQLQLTLAALADGVSIQDINSARRVLYPGKHMRFGIFTDDGVLIQDGYPSWETAEESLRMDYRGAKERGFHVENWIEKPRVQIWCKEPSMWTTDCYDCPVQVPGGQGRVGVVQDGSASAAVFCLDCFIVRMQELEDSERYC